MTKLLLVEDDNNLREIYEARLQAEGYTIVSAHDGEEALVVAKAEKPDLIISDVMMPKISGFEMLDILRNTDGLKDVKVIMLTALGQADDQQRADRLGADRYLVKSQVTLEDIVKVAQELIGGDAATATPAADASAAPTPAPAEPSPASTSPTPATTAAPEPVAIAEPPTEPVTPPETAVSSAPVQDSASIVTDADTTTPIATDPSSAETTAGEEADVEAQIEDFVAGASDDAPSPAAATSDTTSDDNADDAATPPADEPAPSVTPELAVEPVVPAESPEQLAESAAAEPVVPPTPVQDSAAEITAADDKLVSDAADELVVETEPPKVEETAEPTEDGDMPERKKVGGERVIEPIAGEPAKDINSLLIAEEAKEAQAQGQVQGAALSNAIIVDDAIGPVPPAPLPSPEISVARANDGSAPRPDGEKVDPNNIAL